MPGTLAQILATKADLDVTGKIRTEQIPTSVIQQGTKVTVSPTPPSNPRGEDLWIQVEYI